MKFKFIQACGVELEAAWKKPRVDLHGDESFSAADFSGDMQAVGELVSRPMATWDEVENFLQNNWPDATCSKCGFHIHVSFKNPAYYTVLVSEKFYQYFLDSMEDWGRNFLCKNQEFWDRLRGQNRYCKKRFDADAQIKRKEKGHNNQLRRTQLNYCYGIHGTLECRLLPMFKDLRTGISSVKAFITCVEDYLEANPLQDTTMGDYIGLEETDRIDLDEYMESVEIENSIPEGYTPEQKENMRVKLKQSFADKRKRNKKTTKIGAFNFFQVYNPAINGKGYIPKKDRKLKDGDNWYVPQPVLAQPYEGRAIANRKVAYGDDGTRLYSGNNQVVTFSSKKETLNNVVEDAPVENIIVAKPPKPTLLRAMQEKMLDDIPDYFQAEKAMPQIDDDL